MWKPHSRIVQALSVKTREKGRSWDLKSINSTKSFFVALEANKGDVFAQIVHTEETEEMVQ